MSLPVTERPRSRRSAWPFYLALGTILAALPVGYYVFLGSDPAQNELPPPPPPPVAELPKTMDLQISEVSGQVQIRRGGGDWADASKGAILKRADAVRTGDGASAVLKGGEAYEFHMEPGTDVSVEDITDQISKLMLGNGMGTAKVSDAARHTVEVSSAGGDARARTRAGTFVISSNGSGTVAVGSHQGEVEFEGKDKAVIVRPGQQSIIRPGQAPTEPAAVPSSLLLKVRWPERVVRNRTIVLVGEAEPGAQVIVAGKRIKTDANGKFSQTLMLNEGNNVFTVRARNVSGRESEDMQNVQLDTQVDEFRPNIDWGQKAPKQ
jgi:hypothetical protein